jgi:ABC-type branched-subunit amino acid transport system substrate-binding protein
LKKFTNAQYASGWSIQGYVMVEALVAGIKKAGNTKSDDVSKAMAGMSFDTPVGQRSFSEKSHETFAPEYTGLMVKDPNYPFAVIKDPTPMPTDFHPSN